MLKNLFNQVNINVNSEFFQLGTITGSKLIELIVPISGSKRLATCPVLWLHASYILWVTA